MSHTAFWKAICAEPDEDTPRLVYADWLDEQGDPASVARAEFIRAQVELARLDPWTDRAVELKIRTQVLLHDHREEWLKSLPKWIGRPAVVFRRGMPHGFHCSTREFLKKAGGVAKNTPLQNMSFGNLDTTAAERMAELPHLTRMRGLHPVDSSWATWATILASPHLTDLRELHLIDQDRYSAFPLDVFLDALRLPSLRGVERLYLQLSERRPGAGADLLRDVAEVPFARLRELDLTPAEVDPQRLAGVFDSPVAERLVSFRTWAQLDRQALAGFALAQERPALKALQFAISNVLAQYELPAVLASPLLRHVESLTVRGFSDAGVGAIADSPLAAQLRVLRLPGCEATALAYREAFAPGRFRNLVELEIPAWPGRVWRGDTPLAAVADTKGLESLQHLALSGYAWNAPNISLDPLAANPSLLNLSAVTVPPWFENYTLHDPNKRAAFVAKYASRFAVLVG